MSVENHNKTLQLEVEAPTSEQETIAEDMAVEEERDVVKLLWW